MFNNDKVYIFDVFIPGKRAGEHPVFCFCTKHLIMWPEMGEGCDKCKKEVEGTTLHWNRFERIRAMLVHITSIILIKPI